MAGLLEDVIGHKKLIAQMLHSFELGKPGQTYLFVGPSGIGKKKVALGLAQALMCSQSNQGCGECSSCKKMAQGHHEGLKVISPDGAQIKVDQIRELLGFLNLQSLTNYRVIIIDEAQNLNAAAANSLLKTLEEPPEKTLYFLISSSAASVLPTIRSRSRVVSFQPLSEAELRTWPGAQMAPSWAFRAAQGKIENLKDLLDSSEQEYRRECLGQLDNFLSNEDFLYDDSWRQFFKERSSAPKWIGYWILFLRDAWALKSEKMNSSNKAFVYNEDLRDFILSWKNWDQRTIGQFDFLIQDLMRFQEDLKFHRDPVLYLEELHSRQRSQLCL